MEADTFGGEDCRGVGMVREGFQEELELELKQR